MRKYNKPELEVELFDVESVITASGAPNVADPIMNDPDPIGDLGVLEGFEN